MRGCFQRTKITPAWFAGAVETALLPINARLNGIDARLNGMDRRILIAEARAFNCSAQLVNDLLVAPIIPPAVAAPAGFPNTVAELVVLTDENCNSCMNAFGLELPAGVQNTVENKIRLLFRYLGVRVSVK
eukprot:gene29472-38576_t